MKIWDLNLGALPDSWETFVTYTWKQWHFEHEAHVPKYDKEEGWRIKAKKETQVGINGNDTNPKRRFPTIVSVCTLIPNPHCK